MRVGVERCKRVDLKKEYELQNGVRNYETVMVAKEWSNPLSFSQ